MSARRMGRLRVGAVVIAVGGVLAALGSAAPAALAETCKTEEAATFAFTGEQQCYTVPAGVTKLSLTAVGGRGGENIYNVAGGSGAVVSGVLSVIPGSTLYVEVGKQRMRPRCLPRGVFGGGSESHGAGGGGGASDVRAKPLVDGKESLESRLLVAGGGGGTSLGPGVAGAKGGNAGAFTDGEGEKGANGAEANSEAKGGEGGGGGSETAPGKGGKGGFGNVKSGEAGQEGKLGIGGNPHEGFSAEAGGGGGGWWGGGSGGTSGLSASLEEGGLGGGGAGSSYAAACVAEVSIATDTAGKPPEVTIAPVTGVGACGATGPTGPQGVTVTGSASSPSSQVTTSTSSTPNSRFNVLAASVNQHTGAVTFNATVSQVGAFSWLLSFQNGKFGVFSASAKKCKKGQVKLTGRCRPALVIYAKGSRAVASAGSFSFTVKPTASALKALDALRQEHRLPVTATVTFQSSLGGHPTTQTQKLTIKLKNKKK